MGKLYLNTFVHKDIARRSAHKATQESCGLLFRRTDDVHNGARMHKEVRNAASDPANYYQMTSEDMVGAVRWAEELGMTLCGYWHSHPGLSAAPSSTDREAWFDQSMNYLIYSVEGDTWTNHRWINGELKETKVVLVEGD